MTKNLYPISKYLSNINSALKYMPISVKKEQNMSKMIKEVLKLVKRENQNPEDDQGHEHSQRPILCTHLLNKVLHQDVSGAGLIDLAVKDNGTIRAIIEYKCPGRNGKKNSAMMAPDNLYPKSICEVVQYYLAQITGYLNTGKELNEKNNDNIVGIVTNTYDWYVIDNHELRRYFGNNKRLVTKYEEWTKLNRNHTDDLRIQYIQPAVKRALKRGMCIYHINLKDALFHKSQLRDFCRFLSPQGLLLSPILSRNNTINPNFYKELLYIMGLKEKTSSRSHKIVINKSARANNTLARSIVTGLKDHHPELDKESISKITMHLSVVWMNRLLFLKLLESQMIHFNGNDKSYIFLNNDKLHSFHGLFDLFFKVMANKHLERGTDVTRFDKVPYLNSSLFNQDRYEKEYLSIDDLRNNNVKLWKRTILKFPNGKRRTGTLPLLSYLLDFLSDYNFTALSSQKSGTHSNLINAAILGLVFEKINGYKDGAYFTPGWICNMMAKRAVRSAALHKINDTMKTWPNYHSLSDVHSRMFNSSDLTRLEFKIGRIIDSLKICDPAVGSGHFLVSVLNEVLALKSQLGCIFIGEKAKDKMKFPLKPADFKCYVENDELVTYLNNGYIYHYHRDDKAHSHIQKTLFWEKCQLIENCLFGVDINPNSTQICRLRLWIELLKNAYYDSKGDLTTMPNIDINIKTGNSLIHAYKFDADTNISPKELIQYKRAVNKYKNTDDKKIEQDLKVKIKRIKDEANSSTFTPTQVKYQKRMHKYEQNINKLGASSTALPLGDTVTDNKKRSLSTDVKALKYDYFQAKIKYQKSKHHKDHFYDNDMEWRIEYPEILSSTGNYQGFDLVISNPPYIFARSNKFSSSEKKYYTHTYFLAKYQLNTYHMFIELGYDLLKEDGSLAYIVPNNLMIIRSDSALRSFLLNHTGNLDIINSKDKLFKGANVDNCIMYFTKDKPNIVTFGQMSHHDIRIIGKVKPSFFKNDIDNPIFSLARVGNKSLINVYNKISNNIRLGSVADVRDGAEIYEVGKGIPKQTSYNKKHRSYHFADNPNPSNPKYRKFIRGGDINRYNITWGESDPNGKWVKYGRNLAAMRNPKYFISPRILIREIVNTDNKSHSLNASYTDGNNIDDKTTKMILNSDVNLLFVLGVINSHIETIWYAMKFGDFQRKSFPRIQINKINQLPLPDASKNQIGHLATLVTIMINTIAKKDTEKASKIDDKIDDYVTDLYGLTSKDKKKLQSFKF